MVVVVWNPTLWIACVSFSLSQDGPWIAKCKTHWAWAETVCIHQWGERMSVSKNGRSGPTECNGKMRWQYDDLALSDPLYLPILATYIDNLTLSNPVHLPILSGEMGSVVQLSVMGRRDINATSYHFLIHYTFLSWSQNEVCTRSE